MTPPRSLRFRLALSAEEYLSWYSGAARHVLVRCEDGRRLRFPAGAIQPFLTREGIHGRFEIRFDSNNKLTGITRLSDS